MKLTSPPQHRPHTRGLGRRRTLPLLLLFLLLFPSVASADEHYPIEPLQITRRQSEAVFEYNYLQEKQKRDDSDSERKFTNSTFQEYLQYRVDGYAYHPRFLDFRTRFKLGMLQQRVERSGGFGQDDEQFNSNTTLSGYDVYLHFLKEHPLSATLYAQRDRDVVMEVFTDRQLVETERWGGSLHWKKAPFPMDLNVSRSRIREYGVESFSESVYDSLDYTIRHQIAQRMYSELRYQYLDYTQEFSIDSPRLDFERRSDLKSHSLTFNNVYYLDDDRASLLNSVLRYRRQSGSTELDTIQWQETLRLHHTESLDTYYLLSLLENRFENSDVRTWRAEAGLEHQLYRSLRSHFDVHGRWVDFDGSSEDEVGVTARFDYRKDTAWGLLTAGYGRTFDAISRSGRAADRPVVDERVTLSFSSLTFLDEPAIDDDSIEVTDLGGNILYDEGFDYEIEERGNRTGLRLLPGGRIAEGDAVLVDYEHFVSSDFDYIADSQDAYVRYDWARRLEGLATYVRWRDLQARDTPDEIDRSIFEFTDWLYGFSYDWRVFTWTEEYRQYRSTFSDYNELSSRLEASWRANDRVRLSWAGGYLMIDYLDDFAEDDETRIIYSSLGLDGPLRAPGYWRVEAEARRETGRIEQTLLGLIARLGWTWRSTQFEVKGRLESRERFESQQDRAQLSLQITRELGDWRFQ